MAGFTKREDLPYFLEKLCGVEYEHQLLFAPTDNILNDYRKKKGEWQDYESRFLQLIAERKIEEQIDRRIFDVPTVLLCTEPTADHCHRRLVLEYLRGKWGNFEIVHL